jgi:hypothetical protein
MEALTVLFIIIYLLYEGRRTEISHDVHALGAGGRK